jgi:hypothetical protein
MQARPHGNKICDQERAGWRVIFEHTQAALADSHTLPHPSQTISQSPRLGFDRVPDSSSTLPLDHSTSTSVLAGGMFERVGAENGWVVTNRNSADIIPVTTPIRPPDLLRAPRGTALALLQSVGEQGHGTVIGVEAPLKIESNANRNEMARERVGSEIGLSVRARLRALADELRKAADPQVVRKFSKHVMSYMSTV